MTFITRFLQFLARTASPPTPDGLRTRAEQGEAEAQFGLGLQHSTGSGAPADMDQAALWYRKAADQDHALAQFNLGQMLARGQGVPQDAEGALHLFRRSAEGGDAGAQFYLGSKFHRASVDHHQPDGVESRIEAYKWFCLSAAQGYKGSAAARERVALGMSQHEVSAGDQRVAGFAVRSPLSMTSLADAATPG